MVVVDNARKMIGRTIDVVVTSVLQTTAGKMIFGRFIESSAQTTPAPAASSCRPIPIRHAVRVRRYLRQRLPRANNRNANSEWEVRSQS